jgi:hypothetical protein
MPYAPKDPTPATVRANRDAVAKYELADRQPRLLQTLQVCRVRAKLPI